LEIADTAGHIITVIELLSPTNKCDGEHIVRWGQKRKENLAAGVSFVEVDLIRAGSWAMPEHDDLLRMSPGRMYHVACVTRAGRSWRHEFYLCPLRERLPIIRIPLRRGERDAALDLQELIDACYEHGRYSRKLDYKADPAPPLPPEELAWVREIVAR
jgi:hypothetical protein